MDVTTADYYGACDRAIRSMDRSNVEAFGRLKLAKWDQVNVIRTVMAVYRKSSSEARKKYRKVAYEAYLLMADLCGVPAEKARRMAVESVTDGWVEAVLTETDFVTLFRFDTETERKAYRLAEALAVPENRDAEIDKALRIWSRQIGQYAINFTDYAMIMAMDDAGVDAAQWVTMRDEKVCGECRHLDGKIFPLDEIPAKPHWGCRCRLRPVKQ